MMFYDKGGNLKFITREISAGNSKAFDYVFHEFYVSLCRFSFSFIKDQSKAEGVVQEVFIKLWEKRESLSEIDNLLPYMMSMVRNQSIDHIRKEKAGLKAQQKIKPEESANTTEEQLSEHELEEKLLQAIYKLPERCRLAFELSRFEGLTNNEIAAKMNISVKGVEALIGRSLKLLRSELIDFLPIKSHQKEKSKSLLLLMLLNNLD